MIVNADITLKLIWTWVCPYCKWYTRNLANFLRFNSVPCFLLRCKLTMKLISCVVLCCRVAWPLTGRGQYWMTCPRTGSVAPADMVPFVNLALFPPMAWIRCGQSSETWDGRIYLHQSVQLQSRLAVWDATATHPGPQAERLILLPGEDLQTSPCGSHTVTLCWLVLSSRLM